MNIIKGLFQKQFLFSLSIFMVIAATLSMHFLVQPILSIGGSWHTQFISLAYPILDLCFLFASINIYYTAQQHVYKKVISLITASYFLQIIADSIYSYLSLQGMYQPGSFFDPLWVLTTFMRGYAALYMIEHQQEIRPQANPEPSLKLSVYPLVTVVILMVISYQEDKHLMDILSFGVFATILLIIVQKMVIQSENIKLIEKLRNAAGELELKVAERTTELRETNEQLKVSEERYRQLIQISPVFVAVHRHGKFLFINETGAELLGADSIQQILNRSIFDFIPQEFHDKAMSRIHLATRKGEVIGKTEYEIIRLDAKRRFVEFSTVQILYEGEEAFLIVGQDITERKQHEAKIKYMAYHDSLTGLYNRTKFHECLVDEIRNAARDNNKLALLFIDLDRFKAVNDTLGHDVGDVLLQSVTHRLLDTMNETDAIASRLGGDEFTVILPQYTESKCTQLAQAILKDIAAPYFINENQIYVTPSIGISVYPDHGETVQDIMKNADTAMYMAKEKGKNNFQFFDEEYNTVLYRRMILEKALRTALEHHELSIHYQPQLDLHTNELVGLEALLRWEHPGIGPIGPNEFIPIAEETGLITPIGEWVFHTVCRQVSTWTQAGYSGFSVAINISAHQFQDEKFVSMITEALQTTNTDPQSITIEITESIMQNIEQSMKILNILKLLGLKISIDDFGTGYSSLSYLQFLPIDELKIDKSFVDNIHSSGDGIMVRTIINMARGLGFTVIAEGIESEEQVRYLKANDCDIGQGYFFSKPLPVNEVDMMLKGSEKTV